MHRRHKVKKNKSVNHDKTIVNINNEVSFVIDLFIQN